MRGRNGKEGRKQKARIFFYDGGKKIVVGHLFVT